MRYGGVSIEINKQRHIVDHDLDFLVLFPETTSLESRKETLLRWASHLQANTGINASMFKLSPQMKKSYQQSGLDWFTTEYFDTEYAGRTVKRHFIGIDFSLDRSTSLTTKMYDDGIVSEGRWFRKRYQEYFKVNDTSD